MRHCTGWVFCHLFGSPTDTQTGNIPSAPSKLAGPLRLQQPKVACKYHDARSVSTQLKRDSNSPININSSRSLYFTYCVALNISFRYIHDHAWRQGVFEHLKPGLGTVKCRLRCLRVFASLTALTRPSAKPTF